MMNKNWLVTGILALVAAIAYFAPMTDRAFPGLIAPICGTVAVVTIYHLVRAFVSSLADSGEMRPGEGEMSATLAALVAAIVFMFTPAVRAAATRFEPRLLDFTWALLIVAFALPFRCHRARILPSDSSGGAVRRNARPGLCPILAGVAWALGFLDSALFLAFLPFYLILVSRVCSGQTSSRRLFSSPVFLFALPALLAFFAVAVSFHLDLSLFFRRTLVEFTSYYRTPGWIFVFFFTTLPFLAILFSEDGALTERPGFVQLLFHGALSFVTILAVVPPLSPSALMAPYGRLPVATSAFAASVAGYLVAYWWVNRRTKTARAVGGILVLALAGVSIWNLLTFDARAALPVRRVVIKMDAARAQEILRKDPDSSLANYVMGSLALKAGKDAEAEPYLRKAVAAPQPLPFALNDYAEVLRRGKNYGEAERYARQCVACAPTMYVGWETLGSILMDAGESLDEAESAICKACELSKGKDGKPADVRMLISLARLRLKRGDASRAQETIREIRSRQNELSEADRADFERLLKRGGCKTSLRQP